MFKGNFPECTSEPMPGGQPGAQASAPRWGFLCRDSSGASLGAG